LRVPLADSFKPLQERVGGYGSVGVHQGGLAEPGRGCQWSGDAIGHQDRDTPAAKRSDYRQSRSLIAVEHDRRRWSLQVFILKLTLIMDAVTHPSTLCDVVHTPDRRAVRIKAGGHAAASSIIARRIVTHNSNSCFAFGQGSTLELNAVCWPLGWLRVDAERHWRNCERVVFVCTGNICRSPYAEAAARAHGINAVSCGTHTRTGLPADPVAIREAALRGRDMTAHGRGSGKGSS
jgi:Low molecular weight phosphotyrosine protein phosphatase